MKEKYFRPVVINSKNLENDGAFPAVAILGAMGKIAASLLEARPSMKLPSLTKLRRNKNDI